MKKRISFLITIPLACIMMLSACTTKTSKEVTYSVDTGDSVKITIDTKDGFDITMDVPFTVSKGDTDIFTGSFIYAEYYDVYREVVDEESNAVLLDEGNKDGNDYFFYSFEGNAGTEYDYFILIKDSETAIAMASLVGEKEATEAFKAMTISLN